MTINDRDGERDEVMIRREREKAWRSESD